MSAGATLPGRPTPDRAEQERAALGRAYAILLAASARKKQRESQARPEVTPVPEGEASRKL